MQSRNLLPGLTAEENVQLPMILAGRPYRDRAASLLDQVGVAPRRRALPSELSGGEAARVGLAVALALAPSVISRRRTDRRSRRRNGEGPRPSAQRSLRGRRRPSSSRRTARRWPRSPRASFAFRMDGSSMTQPIVKAEGLSRQFGNGDATVVGLEPSTFSIGQRRTHCAAWAPRAAGSRRCSI